MFFAAVSLADPMCAAETGVDHRLKQLEQQNEALQQKLLQQQGLIEDLARKLSDLSGRAPESHPPEGQPAKGFGAGQVRISAEGGVGIYHTSKTGRHSQSDFRVAEARLFLEAPLWENHVFAFAELELMTRERQVTPSADDSFHLGELYVDFEGVSRLWNRPGQLGVRVGRMDIPFGEEYSSRDAIDNPLISHSLADIWGVDEGIALYGKTGPVDYVFAVQNGGHPMLADFNRDKSLTARVGWTPRNWLRLSGSAMRTGDLSVANDKMSELWFGNGFIRALGTGASVFQAAVYEADAQFFWKHGHVKAAGGLIDFSDNAPAAARADREVHYYYVEALQRLPSFSKLYGAARFSQVFADGGFPIVGHGQFGAYFFNPALMTDRMWRASIGAGYQFSRQLTLKVEYTLDHRRVVSVPAGGETHFLGAEIGFAF